MLCEEILSFIKSMTWKYYYHFCYCFHGCNWILVQTHFVDDRISKNRNQAMERQSVGILLTYPVLETMVSYCQLDHWEYTSLKSWYRWLSARLQSCTKPSIYQWNTKINIFLEENPFADVACKTVHYFVKASMCSLLKWICMGNFDGQSRHCNLDKLPGFT